MTDKEELYKAIDTAQEAAAKHQVLSDVCEYFEKYLRKLNGQVKDNARKYEKAKRSNRTDMEYFRV